MGVVRTDRGVPAAVVGAALCAAVWGGVELLVTPSVPGGWLVAATAVWVGQCGYVAALLGSERGPGTEEAPGRLGLANHVTLARGALLAGVAGFAVVRPTGAFAALPAAGYGLAVALDAADGAVARTVGAETDLGETLDMAFDTFGFVVAPVVAVRWGLLPVWYLALPAARPVYRLGLAWHRSRGRPVLDLPDSRVRRPLAALQMVFLTAALAPAVLPGLVWTAAPFVLAPSLLVFARDYLAVTGRLPWRPGAPTERPDAGGVDSD